MKDKWFGCLVVFLVIGLLSSLTFNVVALVSLSSSIFGNKDYYLFEPEPLFEEIVVEGSRSAKDKVALIDLFGIITYQTPGDVTESMVDDFVEKLEQAKNDRRVKAVVIRMDSPGGEVAASDWMYREVLELNEVKPVVIYMDSVAASGAYYAAMGGREIIANDLCITASIGVIMQTMNFKKLQDMVGVDTITFKSGKFKDLLNPSREMMDEERLLVQNLIDETYQKFVGIVADRRGIDVDVLKNGAADGRIVNGRQALEAKLVDKLGYLEDASKRAREIAGLDEETPLVRLVAPYSFNRVLRLLGESKVDHLVEVSLVPKEFMLTPGKLYYISSHLYGAE